MQGQATKRHSETELDERLSKVMKHNDVVAQNYALQQILIRKDSTIERLNNNESFINAQLQSAVSKKADAVNRAKELEDREMCFRRKEKEFEIERDRLNSKIEKLTDNLNRSTDTMKVLQQERSSTEELKTALQGQLLQANSTISRLKQNNRSLKTQLEEKILALQQQTNTSAEVTDRFNKELEATTKLAESHKANTADKQLSINLLIESRSILTERLTEANAKYDDILKKFKLKERDYSILEEKIKLKLEEFCTLQLHCSDSEATIEKLASELSFHMTENGVVKYKLENAELEIKDLHALCEIVCDIVNYDFIEKEEKVEVAKRNYAQLYEHVIDISQKKRNRYNGLSEPYSQSKRHCFDVQEDGRGEICIHGNSDKETCMTSVEDLRTTESSYAESQNQQPSSNLCSAPIEIDRRRRQ